MAWILVNNSLEQNVGKVLLASPANDKRKCVYETQTPMEATKSSEGKNMSYVFTLPHLRNI